MERKAFNFYRSYFDVAIELTDKDRLAFYDAVMNRQFFGIEPILKGMTKFAYISQKHNIDAQVKGWEDKMEIKLQPINNHGLLGGYGGGYGGGSVQEKEKGKEEVKGKEQISCFSFDDFWTMYAKSSDKSKCKSKYDKIEEADRDLIKNRLPIYLGTITDKKYQKNPLTYLNGKCWNDIDDTPVEVERPKYKVCKGYIQLL